VGDRIYDIPPPPVKIGAPARPSSIYAAWAIKADFGPIIKPDKSTTRTCSVTGTTGKGTLRKAPTAVNPAKKEASMKLPYLECIIFGPPVILVFYWLTGKSAISLFLLVIVFFSIKNLLPFRGLSAEITF
jgi:hypothetical protein